MSLHEEEAQHQLLALCPRASQLVNDPLSSIIGVNGYETKIMEIMARSMFRGGRNSVVAGVEYFWVGNLYPWRVDGN